MNLPDFMRPNELAKILRISPKTLSEYRQNGTGPEYISMTQRCVVYRRDDVERWLDAQKRTSTAGIKDRSYARPKKQDKG